MYVTSRQRHNQALLAPSRKDEKAIVQMLRGLQEYGELLEASEAEAARAVLNQGLSDIARGLQKLSQGPLGRLDPEQLHEDLASFIQDNTLSLVQSDADEPSDPGEQCAEKPAGRPDIAFPAAFLDKV